METNSCLSKHSLSSFPSFFRRNIFIARQEGRSECNIFLECRFRSSKLRSLWYRWKFPRFFARFYDIAIFIIVCRRSSIPIRYKSLSVTRYVTPSLLARRDCERTREIQNCTLSNGAGIVVFVLERRIRGGRSGDRKRELVGETEADFCAAEDANRNALEIDGRVVVAAFYDRSPVPRRCVTVTPRFIL